MGFLPREMKLVDEALKRAKAPLAALRELHGVVGDIEFRLRYNSLGEVVAATIEKAPLGLNAAFIDGAIVSIQGTVVFPRPTEPGIIHFVDLGPASSRSASMLNEESDLAAAESVARASRARFRTLWLVIAISCAVAILAVAGALR
jgi:hypothetical protein